jgi:hypothetical protein
LQGVLWSAEVKNLDIQKNKNYIIHQILTYGNFDQIKWLRSVYSDKEIKDVFINDPRKQYTKSSFNFVKNYILGINISLSSDRYDKSTPRNIR